MLADVDGQKYVYEPSHARRVKLNARRTKHQGSLNSCQHTYPTVRNAKPDGMADAGDFYERLHSIMMRIEVGRLNSSKE